MTTADLAVDPTAGTRLRFAVQDALVLAGRNLRHTTRQPELLFFTTVQPVLFVLLFRYVFGGAIRTGEISYVNYLMAGIFVQTTAFSSTSTGVGLAEDLSKGIIDRLRSLPISRSAVLAGRTLGDLVRMVGVVLIMAAVGLVVGLRPASWYGFVAAIGLTALFGFAFSWISAWIGLAVKDVETANVAGFVWLFPLTFASSAFVPLESMPGWLQAFARHTPVTPTCDAVRALLNDGLPLQRPLLISLAWVVGITAVFSVLSVRRYREVT
jgi:ABC-2 type transport system permease protein/oleandomycin transport system permease protein